MSDAASRPLAPVSNLRSVQPDPPGEEYLSIRDLSQRIPYAEQTIRNLMSQGVFRLGEHYLKPRGRVMFRWSVVRAWLAPPAAAGGAPHRRPRQRPPGGAAEELEAVEANDGQP
jgi:hypothetical protein